MFETTAIRSPRRGPRPSHLASAACTIALLGTALAAPTARASQASAVTPALLACHQNAYQVKDSKGDAVESQYSVYRGSTWEGLVTVELWYCPAYGSNFARAEFDTGSSGAGAFTVDLTITGTGSRGGYAQAQHALKPNVYATDGSQDSPTIYSPDEPAYACADPVGPYTFGTGNTCTEAV